MIITISMIIIRLLCYLGVYGILTNNSTFFIIGATSVILEILIEIGSGRLKSLATIFLASIIGVFYAVLNELPIITGILVGLCFESVIMSLISWITLIFTSIFLRKEIKQYNDKVEFADDDDENLNYLHCSNCNKIIADNSLFCMYCGKEVVGNLISDFNEENQNVNVVELSEVKQPSMRWFNFLVKFLMPFWIFFGSISRFGQISSVVRNHYGDWSYYTTNPIDGLPNTIMLVVNVFFYFFLFITWRKVKSFTIQGYKFSIAFFVLIIFLPVITMIIYLPFYIKMYADYDFYNMFVNIASASLLSIPNLIYLRKRKFLFVSDGFKNVYRNNEKNSIS